MPWTRSTASLIGSEYRLVLDLDVQHGREAPRGRRRARVEPRRVDDGDADEGLAVAAPVAMVLVRTSRSRWPASRRQVRAPGAVRAATAPPAGARRRARRGAIAAASRARSPPSARASARRQAPRCAVVAGVACGGAVRFRGGWSRGARRHRRHGQRADDGRGGRRGRRHGQGGTTEAAVAAAAGGATAVAAAGSLLDDTRRAGPFLLLLGGSSSGGAARALLVCQRPPSAPRPRRIPFACASRRRRRRASVPAPAFASRPRLVAAAFPARMALWCAVVMRRVGARGAADVLREYRDAPP